MALKKTKMDYEAQGRRDAAASRARGAVVDLAFDRNSTSWQAVAYFTAFDRELDRLAAGKDETVRVRGIGKLSPDIHEGELVELTRTLQEARKAHVRALALDHNREQRQPRRLRLFKAIGRTLDRAGLIVPIPTVTTNA